MNVLDFAKFSTAEDGKVTICTIDINGKGIFTGIAVCHEDDMDMNSTRTGQHIAYTRAYLKYLKYVSRCEVKPALNALKQLYYSMNKSKFFKEDSYETKMLKAQIAYKEEELAFVREEINMTQADLKSYILVKEEKYKLLRAWREGSAELKRREGELE